MLSKEAWKTTKLALPIILGEVAQMTLHVIDNAMVGAVSYKHLAAAALVFSVVNIPFVFGIGISMSVSQMVSLAHGKQDDGLISHYLFNGFWLCSVFAVVIALALMSGTSLLDHLRQDPEVVELAKPFMLLISASLIPMLLFMALKQFTDGLEKTRVAMILSVGALPVNVFLNWIMIYGKFGFPRLDLVGAGIATLLTRVMMFVALAIMIWKLPYFYRFISLRKEQWHLRKKTFVELLNIGIPSGMQLGLEIGAFAVSAILIGMINAVSLAAHQIAISCAAMTFMVSTGLAQAGSIRTSNNYGRNDWNAIARIGKSTIVTSLIWGAVCAVLFAIFREQIPLVFNNNTEVVVLAGTLLLFAAIFQISDATQAIAAGLLRGIKDVKVPTALIGIAYWVVGIPIGVFLAFYMELGAVGIWLGFISGLTFSALFLIFRFLNRTKLT